MATHRVTAACVVAKDGSAGGESYIYRDGILGPGVPAEEKQRLVDAGLVEVIEDEPAEDEPADAEVEAKPTRGRGRS